MKIRRTSKNKVVDPICGMKVDPCNTALTAEYENMKFYFCAEGCLKAFEKNPEKYKAGAAARKKGIWGRYLDRLNKSTDGKAMKCH